MDLAIENLPTPKPSTQRAILFNLRTGTFTPHVYLETRILNGDEWAFLFQCVETGDTRLWGTEHCGPTRDRILSVERGRRKQERIRRLLAGA